MFSRMPRFNACAGAFCRGKLVDGGGDLNSLGGRGGIFYEGGRGGMAGVGFVYERYLDHSSAKDNGQGSADMFCPEMFFAMSFWEARVPSGAAGRGPGVRVRERIDRTSVLLAEVGGQGSGSKSAR